MSLKRARLRPRPCFVLPLYWSAQPLQEFSSAASAATSIQRPSWSVPWAGPGRHPHPIPEAHYVLYRHPRTGQPVRLRPTRSPSDAAPALSPLPLDPLADLPASSEAALAPASGSAPALAAILFTDIDIPSTAPADGTEAPAAAPFTIKDISTAQLGGRKVLAAQARIAERAELASRYKSRDRPMAFRCKQGRRGHVGLPVPTHKALRRGRAFPQSFPLPDAPPSYGLGQPTKGSRSRLCP